MVHGTNIQVQSIFQLLLGRLKYRSAMHDSGTIEKHIDCSDIISHALDGTSIRDIEAARRDIWNRRQRRFSNIGRDDFRTLPGKHRCRRTANPVAGSRHYGNLAIKSISHSSFLFYWTSQFSVLKWSQELQKEKPLRDKIKIHGLNLS